MWHPLKCQEYIYSFFIPNHSLNIKSKGGIKVFHLEVMRNVSEFDDVVASFALTPLSINTMKFKSLVLGTLLNSDVDNEVVPINVQIETVMLLKLFMIFIQRQQNEVRCLNRCCNNWGSFCTIMLKSPCGMTTSSPTHYWEKCFCSCSTFLAIDLRNWCKTSWEHWLLSFLMFLVETEISCLFWGTPVHANQNACIWYAHLHIFE